MSTIDTSDIYVRPHHIVLGQYEAAQASRIAQGITFLASLLEAVDTDEETGASPLSITDQGHAISLVRLLGDSLSSLLWEAKTLPDFVASGYGDHCIKQACEVAE